MLKFLKKRSTGKLQEFDQAKSNAWFAWAAPGLESRLDWMTFISRIIETSPEVMDSQEYQKRLIDDCAIMGSTGNEGWPYMVMGGRLYTVYLLKKIHGDKYPTVKQVQDECVAAGLMRKMDYSDEELEFLDKHVIDHELNFSMSYPQVEQYFTKYSLRSNTGNKVYETPQFTVLRAAMAVAEYVPKHIRLQEVAFLYKTLADDRFNPPTPNYGGLGTNHFGLASCCLIAATDTAESIAAAGLVAYMQTVASAGLGISLDIRNSGDPVSNGRVRHAGKLNYVRKLFGDTNANKQGMRGGAVTIYDTIYSPEIELMCRLQNPLTPEARRERRVNVAIQDNPFFATKVARREKYFTFTSYTAPDLYKALTDKDHSKFEELYHKYEADPDFVKDYRDAYETATMFENQRHEISTLFWQNIHETNRHTAYDDPILSANLCVSPETEVLTDQGYFPIYTLENQKVNVWNGFEYSETTIVRTSENSELIKVSFDNGLFLECTPYHKFYVQEGYRGQPVEVRAKDLKPGMALMKADRPVIGGHNVLDEAYANGFYSADGCDTRQGKRIYLYGSKRKLRGEFNISKWTVQENQDREYGHMENLKSKYFVPLAGYDIDSRLEWLAGFLDGDGCVYRNGTNQQLTASSTNLDFLRQVTLMLQTLGIQARIGDLLPEGERPMPDGRGGSRMYQCNSSYRLLINSNDTQSLLSMGLNLRRLALVKDEPQRNAARFVRVTEIIDTGRHDATFCFTEPKRHLGIFNGLITGQCMEVTNPTAPFLKIIDLYGDGDPARGEVGFCNIGSIPLNRHKFNMNDIKEGYEEYKTSVRAQMLFIDYAIEHNNYGFPALAIQAKARRNASVGMSGLATLLAEHNLKYDTPEGRKAMHMLAERHMYACIEVSIELGQERGNAPWIHRTAWARGWTPLQTYKKNIDKFVDATLYFDWDEISQRLIDNKGMRFSSLVAHMPGEQATRKGVGSNSLYPLFRLSVDKTDGTASIPWAAYNNDLWGDRYQIAYDISNESQHIFYGIFQKFADQTTSADEYKDRIAEPILESDTLAAAYLDRHYKGLKTVYYNRSLTPAPEALKEIRKQLEKEADEVVEAAEVAPKKSALDNIVIDWDAVEMEAGSSCTTDGACGT